MAGQGRKLFSSSSQVERFADPNSGDVTVSKLVIRALWTNQDRVWIGLSSAVSNSPQTPQGYFLGASEVLTLEFGTETNPGWKLSEVYGVANKAGDGVVFLHH